MRIENDRGLSKLLRSAEEERLCTGFRFTEGPIWIPQDGCLLFSDIPNNRIHRWRPGTDAAEVYREPSGNSNGLTLDGDGRLLACEHSGRRVSRAAYGGPAEAVVDRFEGKKFNSPNDVVAHSSGRIYFTDPDYGLRGNVALAHPDDPEPVQELAFLGVYKVEPDGGMSVLVDDMAGPNGLALSPDEHVLYIGDSRAKIIMRHQVAEDGRLHDGVLFADQRDDARFGAPDGMKVDEEGRLWTTGAGGVSVYTPDGDKLGDFEMAEHAANISFGGADFTTLFLTARTSVYRVETSVRGIAPGSR
jgi:gluconolactonase